MNSKACFYTNTLLISLKCSSTLNTHSNDFIRTCIERVTSRKRNNRIVRGEGGVAGEGRVVGLPKFHSWDKCTMLLTNINSDWMSNTSSGLRITLLYIYYITWVLYFASWGANKSIWSCKVAVM